MALYHKWGVKTGFTFALQFFLFISDSLGGVRRPPTHIFKVQDREKKLSLNLAAYL
jgi:hypothetical protein